MGRDSQEGQKKWRAFLAAKTNDERLEINRIEKALYKRANK